MNKQYYYDICQGQISKASIKEYSGSYVIMGKYGMIENIGTVASPYWDIWVTGVHLGKELSTNRVNLLASALKSSATSIDIHFNQELTCRCMDENKIGALAVLLGAKKKRKISPEQIEKQIATLAKARKKAAN